MRANATARYVGAPVDCGTIVFPRQSPWTAKASHTNRVIAPWICGIVKLAGARPTGRQPIRLTRAWRSTSGCSIQCYGAICRAALSTARATSASFASASRPISVSRSLIQSNRQQSANCCLINRRHPGLDPGSATMVRLWMPDQVRDDERKLSNGSLPPHVRPSLQIWSE
jgi:hypothetical protein